MAKWGEGDPRWLVEERPDATNVNNWHWTEKNACQWSKQKFNEIFIGQKIETDFAHCTITEITKCDGDAVVNNRKAKLIVFYEWGIHLKWMGSLIHGDTEVKGTIEIPNLSEEHDLKDVDVNVYVDTTGPESDILKDMMRTIGVDCIRKHLSTYITALKEEFAKTLILPTKDSAIPEPAVKEKSNKKANLITTPVQNFMSKNEFETTEWETTESFKCTADEFYRAMTVKDLVKSFTQGDCILDVTEGGKFELFDGNVSGTFTKLVPNNTIHLKWRFKTWPENHYSNVTIDIDQKMDSTEIHFKQTDVPKTDLEHTQAGWKRFYWESMRRTLGFGALLF